MEQELRQKPGPSWWPDLRILKQVARRALDQDINATATQIAFHISLSFFPMLLVLAFILTSTEAPFLFARIMLLLQGVLPPEVAALIEQVIDEVRTSSWGGFLIGLSLALWWSVSGLEVLIRAINRAYGISEHRPYWKRCLVSLWLTVVLTVLLVLATALTFTGDWLGVQLARWLRLDNWFVWIWAVLRWSATLLAVVAGLVVLYAGVSKLPLLAWQVLPGAVLGGSLWVAATLLFAWYITNFAAYSRIYGSIGGVIVLMLWMYVCAFVVLLGAELNGTLYLRRFAPVDSDRP